MRFIFVLVAFAVVAQAQEPLVLKYEIERSGNAIAVEVVSPGAAESRHAVRLTHALKAWSRFNWPVFRTAPRAEAVSLSIRREGPAPEKVHVRVVRADGVEWQSAAVATAESWQTIVFTAKDFTVFRGADQNSAGSLSFADVIQIQLVPKTQKEDGQGVLFVDEVRLLPEGPAFTHEDNELRRRVTDPAELEFCRLNDLRSRWSSELAALKAADASATRWKSALAQVLAAAHSGSAVEALHVLNRESPAWQQPAAGLRPRAGDEALPLLSRAVFDQKLAACAAGEPQRLTDYAIRQKIRRYTMYRAPKQPDVEVVDNAGEKSVRQRIIFSGEDAQQVVFVTVDLPDDGVDVQGRRIFVKMRCTARGLNEKQPLVMRLNTRGSDNSESWAQFKPQALPAAEWGEAVFALEAPAQNVRFNPRAVRQIAVRVENVPGKADDFVLELGAFRLGWPEPLTRVRREELQAIDASVYAARATLFSKRAAVTKMEDELRVYPELHAGYWASFENPAARHTERITPLNLKDAGGAGKALSPDRIRIRTVREKGELAVEISQDVDKECELSAELRSVTGETAAAGRVKGTALRLAVSRAALWRAGNANLYEATVRVARGEKTEACVRKTLGLRVSEVRPSGQTTVLRQAVNRRWPDWSYRWNGQGDFGRFACYDMPERFPSDDSVRKMMDSLWVDGVRLYGFSVNANACGWYDRNGVAQLASVSPSFRSLAGWSGMEGFRDAYSGRCAYLDGAADSASVAVLQVGNEVELAEWGADISGAFPLAPYQPIDHLAEAVKEQGLTAAPVMYVRAGRFTVIPPMPHEDVCGVNQYTGRYSGRMDEIERDLAELAIQSVFANRPLMITEWNGPKYSWASGGIGGVTTRGAAYYLERYWRGLIDTPGIVGSSEFTLNWVIAPFEDLTNQTREEAWKNRLKHSRFSELHPADHVPLLMPGQVFQDECFGAMKAFHGPLYVMMQRPGAITLVYGDSGKPAAERLAGVLSLLGKDVRCRTDADFESALSNDAGHVVALLPQGSRLRSRLEDAGIIERPAAARSEPVIQTRVHPYVADRLLVTVTADSGTAFADGVGRLAGSADELLSLRRREGAMGRVVALADAERSRIYERYILEQTARGYLVAGDDTRTELKEADFYVADGRRRASWSDWAALILDCGRALSAAELDLVKRACEEGVNVVVSRACYNANAGLQAWCGARLEDAGTLAERFDVSARLMSPIPVKDMGGAQTNVIARFAPKHAGSGALGVSRMTAASDAAAWVVSAAGEPVVLAWRRGKGHAVLFGCDFGQAAEIHWDVTHAGETHRLYDRETACGLERVSRCVVNACLAGRQPERMVPRLYLRVVPDEVQVCGGLEAVAAADVLLCDAEGRPVVGELLARARASEDGRAAASGTFASVKPVAPGRFRVVCAPEGKEGSNISYAPVKELGALWTVLSLQLKAYAEGHVPADGAAAFIVTP